MVTLIAVPVPEVCDRCGAQASWCFTRATIDTRLYFCSHHTTEYLAALADAEFSPAMLVIQAGTSPRADTGTSLPEAADA